MEWFLYYLIFPHRCSVIWTFLCMSVSFSAIRHKHNNIAILLYIYKWYWFCGIGMYFANTSSITPAWIQIRVYRCWNLSSPPRNVLYICKKTKQTKSNLLPLYLTIYIIYCAQKNVQLWHSRCRRGAPAFRFVTAQWVNNWCLLCIHGLHIILTINVQR